MGVKIAIDAGHGSNTSGKRTPTGYREHWANVKVASYFAKAMDRCGISYIKTGWNDDNATDDVNTSLSTRQKQIKTAKCDYSISFHFNASGNGKTYNTAQGIETLISNKSVGDSLKMANTIHKYLIQGTSQKNRGVKTQSLAMCNCGVMGTKASILIECAFMTNQYEESLMKSDSFCNECAEEAAKGFCEYIGVNYVQSNGNIVNNTSSSTDSVSLKYVYNNLDYSVVFNPTYYANTYADLKKAFGTNATALFNHFKQYGMKEGRKASSNFDVKVYKEKYTDLQKAFGTDYPSYYKHYIQYGKKEGRIAV